MVLWSSLTLKDAFVWCVLAGLGLVRVRARGPARAGRDGRRQSVSCSCSSWTTCATRRSSSRCGRSRSHSCSAAGKQLRERAAIGVAVLVLVPAVLGYGVAAASWIDDSIHGRRDPPRGEHDRRRERARVRADRQRRRWRRRPSSCGLPAVVLRPYPWERSGSLGLKLAQLEALLWYPLLALSLYGLTRAWPLRRTPRVPSARVGRIGARLRERRGQPRHRVPPPCRSDVGSRVARCARRADDRRPAATYPWSPLWRRACRYARRRTWRLTRIPLGATTIVAGSGGASSRRPGSRESSSPRWFAVTSRCATSRRSSARDGPCCSRSGSRSCSRSFFGRFVPNPVAGLPYAVFMLPAMVVWQFFSKALSMAGVSLSQNYDVVTKVFFPRIFLPLARSSPAFVDLLFALAAAAVVMLFYQRGPSWAVVLAPLFVLVAIAAAIGFSVFFAAFDARFRDLRLALPFVLQLWFFVTPVVYSSTTIPERYRWVVPPQPDGGRGRGLPMVPARGRPAPPAGGLVLSARRRRRGDAPRRALLPQSRRRASSTSCRPWATSSSRPKISARATAARSSRAGASATSSPRRPGATARRGAAEPFWALRHVDLEVMAGQVTGVIGRNGAGKSTLLKLLSRITTPSEGRAEIRGRVGSLLEVGTGFHIDLTGRENVFFSGAVLGMSRAEVRRKFDDDRRVRRRRALHRHTGEALLERHAGAARLRGRRPPRARDPDRRRGPRGRRRGVPATVPRQDRGGRANGPRDPAREPRSRRGPQPLRRRAPLRRRSARRERHAAGDRRHLRRERRSPRVRRSSRCRGWRSNGGPTATARAGWALRDRGRRRRRVGRRATRR